MSQQVEVYRKINFHKSRGPASLATLETDVSATVLYLLPATDDTESLNIGNGTKDMDVKIFLGTTSKHVLFDVGNSCITITGTPLSTTSSITATGIITSNGGMTMGDAKNIAVNTTTGTKIGTAIDQKIGFWNATPVVQQAHVADPSGGATVDAEARTAINSINALCATLGITAAA